MRVAALYDVHGNLPALEAVLGEPDVAASDAVVVGGDVASGPMPREVIDRLTALGDRVHFVRGNSDRELVAAYDGLAEIGDASPEWVALQRSAAGKISRAQRDFVAQWPLRLTLTVDGLGAVLFCHATPRRDTEIVTALTPEASVREILAGVEEDVVVCGHTHGQYERMVSTTLVVNAGSVGLPYEGRRGAYWALLGPAVELRRTEYDVDAAVALIRDAGGDAVEGIIVETLLEPPAREETAEQFERMAAVERS